MRTIRRAGYARRAYTRKNGRRVRGTRVAAGRIRNRGQAGKWTSRHRTHGIGPLKKGRLAAFGYSSTAGAGTRHTALKKAIEAYGATAVYRMLNAVYVYTRRTTPAKSNLYKSDRNWVGKAHGLGR